jgi:aldehyde dehydrogenase (NAD+)
MVQVAPNQIGEIVRQQRQFFSNGETKSVEFRIAQLQALKRAILGHQDDILAALTADLNKPAFETFATEIGIVRDIDYALKQIRSWVKPKRVKVPFDQFPASAKVIPEPLGVVLIIGPWNYPFQLIMSPLVGAIAAGNCVLLKPSEVAPQTSSVVAKILQKTFDPAYVSVVEGGVETSKAVLAEKFDHIFFTGGTAIGKIVMAAAAQHLTPVTLELGGKSPCIVDRNISIEDAARRITWGKFINAGQTCIAPDYLLVDRQVKPALLNAIQSCIGEFYGDDPAKSPDYARIVSPKQFARLENLLQDGKILAGGETNPQDRYIAPTLMDQVSLDDAVMQEEIFGPILPVLEYEDLGEAIALINSRPKPLALYLFSRDKQIQQRVLQNTSSGGVCINDTIMQVGVPELPFGGVGDSGIGSYHGRASFDTFSHQKSVLQKPFWFGLKILYPPYNGKLDMVKKLMG